MADERGSIVSVTDSAGATLRINTYDEYGIPASTNLGRFQYTGQTWLPEAGLYHYKARMYSPTLGRFMQTDPIGYADGMNWYAYVGGDPVNFRDPLGLYGVEDEPRNDDIIVPGVKERKIPEVGYCDTHPYASGCGDVGDYVNRDIVVIARSRPARSRSTLVRLRIRALRTLYCSMPSVGGGFTAGGYAGLGGGVTGEAAIDPASGRVSVSAGVNVGVGVGFSAAGTANMGRGVSNDAFSGSVGANANVAVGPARVGAAATLIDNSGFNPSFNGVNGGTRAGGGLTANANLTARGGASFQLLPGCSR